MPIVLVAAMLRALCACQGPQQEDFGTASVRGTNSIQLHFVDLLGREVKPERFVGSAVDAGGTNHLARCVSDGVVAFEGLVPGTYWISVVAVGWKRKLEVAHLDGSRTSERCVVLEPESRSGRGLALGESEGRRFIAELGEADTARYRVEYELVDEEDERTVEGAQVILVSAGRKLFEWDDLGGRLDLSVEAGRPSFLEIRAPGYAPRRIELSDAVSGNLGPLPLTRSIDVHGRIDSGDGSTFRAMWCEYASAAASPVANHLWTARVDEAGGFTLELGPEPFFLRGWAWTGKREVWTTPSFLFDPRTDGNEVLLRLTKTVPVVLSPMGIPELLEIEVRDSSGFLVLRDTRFGDLPRRLDLMPGDYDLRFPDDEFESRRIQVGPEGLRIDLLDAPAAWARSPARLLAKELAHRGGTK